MPTRDALEGIRDGFLFTPLYLPIAIPYAIAAQALGLADWQILLWSALIFAGSAQLACLSALATGAGLAELLVITFMANARHSFVAMVIAPYYSRVPPRWLPVVAFTSSVGAMSLLPRRRGGNLFAYGLATQMCQWCIWVGGAALGLWIGPLIPAAWAPVLGFCAPAAFIGLLNPMVREHLASGLVVAAVGAALGLGLTVIWPPQICAIVGAIGGSLASREPLPARIRRGAAHRRDDAQPGGGGVRGDRGGGGADVPLRVPSPLGEGRGEGAHLIYCRRSRSSDTSAMLVPANPPNRAHCSNAWASQSPRLASCLASNRATFG